MKNTYPRPQLKREQWQNLNGSWQLAFDDRNRGLKERWYEKTTLPDNMTIEVPFSVQSELSGVADKDDHPIIWYARTFDVAMDHPRIILNVGAIDYEADIFINGAHVKHHRGGHVSFSVDITHVVKEKDNTIHIRVYDDMHDIEIPRGKQYWKSESENIFYTRTSGIWQTIWLEAVPRTYIKRVKMIPDILTNTIKIGFYLNRAAQATLKTTITYQGDPVVETEKKLDVDYYETVCFLGKSNDQDDKRLWTPEHPNLYDVVFNLKTDEGTDVVESYFGMRKISIEKGQVMLNNRPYYMKLVLDQGYYPGGLLTSPNDDAIKNDIELTKQMGFNGVRKHQKIEEERYLYHADRLGLLVWEEMPSAYKFSSKTMKNLTDEWQRAIDRDFNHPAIVAWVPINESWGVPNLISNEREVHFLEALYHLTKAKDDTRLVISNDGWEHGTTDLLTIHDYEADERVLRRRYENIDNILSSIPGHHLLYNAGFQHQGEPIMVTEFGGISYQNAKQAGWGYSSAENDDDFIARLKAVFKPLYASDHVQGVCYTKLTDIEQEINGLLTFDRQPKVPLKTIKAIVNNEND